MIARRVDTGERVGARAATAADRQVTIGQALREERATMRVEYPEGALVGDASRLIEGAIERAPKRSPRRRRDG
jgi:hypothetical protein